MALVVENWCGAATIVGIGAGRGWEDGGERGERGRGRGDRAAFCQLTSLDTACDISQRADNFKLI